MVHSPIAMGINLPGYDSVRLMCSHLLLLSEDSRRAESLPLPFELPTDSLPWDSLPCESLLEDSIPLPLEPLPPISTSSCKGGRVRFLLSCDAACSWLLSLPSDANPSSGSSSTPSRPPQPSLYELAMRRSWLMGPQGTCSLFSTWKQTLSRFLSRSFLVEYRNFFESLSSDMWQANG